MYSTISADIVSSTTLSIDKTIGLKKSYFAITRQCQHKIGKQQPKKQIRKKQKYNLYTQKFIIC